jgi:molybdopterin-biosynthesis enzyme MoeA-like protein
VFTLAGVPSIARAMLEDIGHRLQTGKVIHKMTVRGVGLREGEIAEPLGALAKEMPDVSFGSYPWFRSIGDNGVHLVASTVSEDLLPTIEARLSGIVTAAGVTPQRVVPETA